MSYDNILAHGESLFLEYLAPSVKIKRRLKKDSQKIAAKVIDPNTVGNGQMLEEFRSVIQQIRKDMKMEKPLSVPVTREFMKEMDKEILVRAGGERKNINPGIVAEVLTDKSMVANICTPDQRERFVDLMEEILTEYGGEDGGAGEDLCFLACHELRPLEKMFLSERRDLLLYASMDALPEIERKYIDYHYGFATGKPIPRTVVAEILGVPVAEANRIEADALEYFRDCFHVDRVNAFYELRPEAEKQKELARKSHESRFDNFAGTHVDMLLAQYDE